MCRVMSFMPVISKAVCKRIGPVTGIVCHELVSSSVVLDMINAPI